MNTVKIDFELEIEDGYPPISVERLNAKECGDGLYEILNTPFFVPETAYGDIVSATKNSEGRLIFSGCAKESKFKALSIIILDSGIDSALMDDLRGRDCVLEYGEFGALRVLAVGVSSDIEFDVIKNILNKYEQNDKLSYAELVA